MHRTHVKQLGQYFTPPEIVHFILETLQKLDSDTCFETRQIIDPACGEGEFLLAALEQKYALAQHIYGIDKDPLLQPIWEARGLRPAPPWLVIADGLTTLRKGKTNIEPETFDWVVGNPPYGWQGLKSADDRILEILLGKYQLPHLRWEQKPVTSQMLRNLPVEILFIERFVQLCKPGGLIAVILPVGLFANQRWRFVRQWLLEQLTLEMIIDLPRNTFRAGKITAKTCILIARKGPAPPGHEVLLQYDQATATQEASLS